MSTIEPGVTPPAEPTKPTYTVKAPDGSEQTYTADTEAELLTKVNAAHNELYGAFKTRETENADLRKQNSLLSNRPAPAAPPPTAAAAVPKDNQFNNAYYYQLLAKDPLDAQEYIDRYRFGGADPKEFLSRAAEYEKTHEQMVQSAQVSEFHRRVPQFPATAPASAALEARVGQLGMGVNANSLELAYYQLENEGAITATAPSSDAVTQTPPAAIPPVDSGQSGSPPVTLDDVEGLTLDQLKERVEAEYRRG